MVDVVLVKENEWRHLWTISTKHELTVKERYLDNDTDQYQYGSPNMLPNNSNLIFRELIQWGCFWYVLSGCSACNDRMLGLMAILMRPKYSQSCETAGLCSWRWGGALCQLLKSAIIQSFCWLGIKSGKSGDPWPASQTKTTEKSCVWMTGIQQVVFCVVPGVWCLQCLVSGVSTIRTLAARQVRHQVFCDIVIPLCLQ